MFPVSGHLYELGSLKEEVGRLDAWRSKNASHTWTCATLKGLDGEDGEFLTRAHIDGGAERCAYTDSGNRCPSIRALLESMGEDVYLVRLLKLAPGGEVLFHTDDEIFRDTNKVVRLHLPIVTNPGALMRMGTPLRAPARGYNIWEARQRWEVHLQAGRLWFTNVNALHSVVNKGEDPRVHLVIDAAPSARLASAIASWDKDRIEV